LDKEQQMKNYMKRDSRFMQQYYALFSDENIMSSHQAYYAALAAFVKRNNRYFRKEVLQNSRLDMLIELDPAVYVNPETTLSLETEKNIVSQRE